MGSQGGYRARAYKGNIAAPGRGELGCTEEEPGDFALIT